MPNYIDTPAMCALAGTMFKTKWDAQKKECSATLTKKQCNEFGFIWSEDQCWLTYNVDAFPSEICQKMNGSLDKDQKTCAVSDKKTEKECKSYGASWDNQKKCSFPTKGPCTKTYDTVIYGNPKHLQWGCCSSQNSYYDKDIDTLVCCKKDETVITGLTGNTKCCKKRDLFCYIN